eukprot:scaffold2390_cov125-Isochrysis_galbana.AAC.1
MSGAPCGTCPDLSPGNRIRAATQAKSHSAVAVATTAECPHTPSCRWPRSARHRAGSRSPRRLRPRRGTHLSP